MLSNEELPDIIWYSFAADAESLLEDGIIRDLTDLLPKYAPNYWKFLQENPLYYKSMMTDSGKFFGFGFFREDLWQTAYALSLIHICLEIHQSHFRFSTQLLYLLFI